MKREQPEIIEFQSELFSPLQLDTLSTEVDNWIYKQIKRYYGLGPRLYGKEWRIVKPLCLSADGNRAALTLLMRSSPNDELNLKNSMTWIGGFMYKGKWYFKSIIGTQYIDSQSYGLSKGVPLSWETLEEIGEKEIQAYLKYDSSSDKWSIDEWWVLSQAHNVESIQEKYGDLSQKEIMELPYGKFMDIEMPRQLATKFVLKIKEREFEKQYQNFLAGKYTEAEWSKLEDMRQRRTNDGKKEYLLFLRDINRSEEVRIFRDTVSY